MLIIAVVILSVIAGVLAGMSLFVSIRNQRKEFQRSKRVVKALRRYIRRRLIGALSRHAEETERAMVDSAKKAAEDRMPAVLSKLREEQRKVNATLARWLRREERRLVVNVEMRLKPVENAMDNTTKLTGRLFSWIKAHNPLGHKPEAENKKSPSVDGDASK